MLNQQRIIASLFLAATQTVTGFSPSTLRQARCFSPATNQGVSKTLSPISKRSAFFGVGAEKKVQIEDVTIDPDFKLATIFLSLGVVLDFIPYVQFFLGLPVTLLGILFLVQTFRIRFVFESGTFNLKQGDDLNDTGENIVVGGANSWAYDSFVNYDFFPQGWIDQPQGPILVYFKETQTPSDQWNTGPGEKANNEESIKNGAVPGQVHFFPALCNTKQLRDEFERRGCMKL